MGSPRGLKSLAPAAHSAKLHHEDDSGMPAHTDVSSVHTASQGPWGKQVKQASKGVRRCEMGREN